MPTMFNLAAAALFIATAGLYVVRGRREDPPLAPYILVALASATGIWLSGEGAPLLAIPVLVIGAFLLLHLASLPYREDEAGPRR